MTQKPTAIARTLGILLFALAAGCAGLNETSPGTRAQADPVIADPALPAPVPPVAVAAELPQEQAKGDANPAAATPPVEHAGTRPEATPATLATRSVTAHPSPKTPAPAPHVAAKDVTRPANAPERAAASAPSVPEASKHEIPGSAARPAEPTLDVADLKTRLRETHAIGTFTKIVLKNQMDDLLQQFRAVYEGGNRARVASLRQPFDTLVLKVLSVVKDGDPSLARTISASREAIWGILSDPVKFKSVS